MALQDLINEAITLGSVNPQFADYGRDYFGNKAKAGEAKWNAGGGEARLAELLATPGVMEGVKAASSPSFLDKVMPYVAAAGAAYMGGSLLSGLSGVGGAAATASTTGAQQAALQSSFASGLGGAGSGLTAANVIAGGAPLAAGGMLSIPQAAQTVAQQAMQGATAAPAVTPTAAQQAVNAYGGTYGTAGQALTAEQVASLAGNPQALAAYQAAGMLPAGLISGAAAAPFDITNPATYPWGQIASTALTGVGGLMQGQAATDAARTAADAQIRAAQIAADAAKFRPVGVTTGFGTSKFGYDAQGNLISAGYQLTPEMQAQQRSLMGISGQALGQYGQAMGATAPLGAGAQQAMTLGQGYLGTSPQAQAQQYMAEQQALLAPARDRERAALEARQAAMGTGGLMVGGINPREFSRQQALAEQDLALAAQATQGGMDYAKFGAGMMGAGGDLLKQMYGTQQAAYAPYQTALGGATAIEGLGQQAMDIGTAIGAKTSTAGAQAGLLQARGLEGAAQTMQQANAYSPWGALLSGAGQAVGQYGQPQQQYRFDPFTGRAL